MSLINHTFFVGEINIPNTNKPEVVEALSLFINKYEEKFLTELLGYELYKNFMAGLKMSPIEQVWLSLLFGTDYTYNSRIGRWKGLIVLPEGMTATIDMNNTYEAIVGRGNPFDPTENTTTATLPPNFVAVPFKVYRRGVGELRSDEYTVTGNQITLTNTTFTKDETLFYEKNTGIGINNNPAAVPHSVIANYVYYYWMRDKVSMTTGIGEAKAKSENASVVSPAYKMAKAWNEMVEEIWSLTNYLTASKYTGWDFNSYYDQVYSMRGFSYRMKDIFYPINTFNL